MKNDGGAAERAFVDYWQTHGHIQRLRDKKDLMGINKGARIADFPKPSDFLVSSPTETLHYAEVKSTVNPTLFPFGDIRPAQSAAALKEARQGSGNYKFYIFAFATGEWYIMDCMKYGLCLAGNRRSVKFEELEKWHK